MTKIIPFRTNNQQEYQVNNQPQHRQAKITQQLESDTVEFVDCILEDDIKPKKVKKVETTLANAQLMAMAWDVYNEAWGAKQNVKALISVAKSRGFSDILNLQGNLTTFSEDNLGRIVMTECDKKGKDERVTTFYPADNEILKIESDNSKIVFFDYGKDYTEVTKTTKPNLLGKSIKEVYCYEYGKPSSYKKYSQSLFKEDVLVQSCIF